jgi:RNase H-fold protein (predicted Holliday junction resolvase)
MVILGISIGTRVTGIAVVNNTELIAWQSHTFTAQWSKAKMEQIITRYEKYLRSHKVTMVIIKIPRLSHHNASIRDLLSKLRALITFNGCMMDYTTLNEIKTKLPQVQNASDIQDYILNIYPVLLPEHTRERVNKKPYHHKMFEAVLIAHLWKDRDI